MRQVDKFSGQLTRIRLDLLSHASKDVRADVSASTLEDGYGFVLAYAERMGADTTTWSRHDMVDWEISREVVGRSLQPHS